MLKSEEETTLDREHEPILISWQVVVSAFLVSASAYPVSLIRLGIMSPDFGAIDTAFERLFWSTIRLTFPIATVWFWIAIILAVITELRGKDFNLANKQKHLIYSFILVAVLFVTSKGQNSNVFILNLPFPFGIAFYLLGLGGKIIGTIWFIYAFIGCFIKGSSIESAFIKGSSIESAFLKGSSIESIFKQVRIPPQVILSAFVFIASFATLRSIEDSYDRQAGVVSPAWLSLLLIFSWLTSLVWFFIAISNSRLALSTFGGNGRFVTMSLDDGSVQETLREVRRILGKIGCGAWFIIIFFASSYMFFENSLTVILISLLSILGIFGWAFWIVERRKEKQTEARKKINSLPTLSISLPKTTKWQPTTAINLISNLFSLHEPIALQIVANKDKIIWRIKVSKEKQQATIQHIRTFHPQAEITEKEPTATPNPIYLAASAPYFAPLTYATDHKTMDPLASIVSAMSSLTDEEYVIYQINITQDDTNYNKQGFDRIHKRPSRILGIVTYILHLVTLGTWGNVLASAEKVGPQYDAKSQRMYEEKLNSDLRAVDLMMIIRAHNNERSNSLWTGLRSAMSIYDGDFNLLRVKQETSLLDPSKDTNPLILNPQEVAALWHCPTQDIKSDRVNWLSGVRVPAPEQLTTQTPTSSLIGFNEWQGKKTAVFIDDDDRIRHTQLLGRTGVGKTTLFHHLIHSDIQRGNGVALIESQGDLNNFVLAYSIPEHREDDLEIFDLSPGGVVFPLNPLYVPPQADEYERYQIRIIAFGALSRAWDEPNIKKYRWGRAFEQAITLLVETGGGTIRDIPSLLANSDFRLSRMRKLPENSTSLEYWHKYGRLTEAQQLEREEPITDRIYGLYQNPTFLKMMSAKGRMDFRNFMDDGKIFLANLSGDRIIMPMIGAMLLAQFQLAALSRRDIFDESQRRYFSLNIDEVQNYKTETLPELLEEIRKYNVSVTIGNQGLYQLTKQVLESTRTNITTNISFRLGQLDAATLAPFIAGGQFDKEMLANYDYFNAIVSTAKGQETLPAFNIVTPMPLVEKEHWKEKPELLQRLEYLKDKVRKRYEAQTEADPEPTRTTDTTDRTCPNCQANNDTTDRFCRNCGYKLTQDSPETTSQDNDIPSLTE